MSVGLARRWLGILFPVRFFLVPAAPGSVRVQRRIGHAVDECIDATVSTAEVKRSARGVEREARMRRPFARFAVHPKHSEATIGEQFAGELPLSGIGCVVRDEDVEREDVAWAEVVELDPRVEVAMLIGDRRGVDAHEFVELQITTLSVGVEMRVQKGRPLRHEGRQAVDRASTGPASTAHIARQVLLEVGVAVRLVCVGIHIGPDLIRNLDDSRLHGVNIKALTQEACEMTQVRAVVVIHFPQPLHQRPWLTAAWRRAGGKPECLHLAGVFAWRHAHPERSECLVGIPEDMREQPCVITVVDVVIVG